MRVPKKPAIVGFHLKPFGDSSCLRNKTRDDPRILPLLVPSSPPAGTFPGDPERGNQVTTLPKSLVIFCFHLCAYMYIGIGTYGFFLSFGSKMFLSLTLWHSAAFAAASLLLIGGIGFFGRLWDKIVAREAAISNSPPGK